MREKGWERCRTGGDGGGGKRTYRLDSFTHPVIQFPINNSSRDTPATVQEKNWTVESVLMDFHTSLPLTHNPHYFLPLKSI